MAATIAQSAARGSVLALPLDRALPQLRRQIVIDVRCPRPSPSMGSPN